MRKYLLYIVKVSLLAIIYFFAARFGLGFDPVSGFATPVWPPTGISIAALILLGIEFWPGILIGAFAANYVTGASVPVAAGIGVGNMLEALLAAYLLRKTVGLKSHIESAKDGVGFIVFGVIASPMVSATIGVTSLLFGGVVLGFDAYWTTWWAWYVGDALGALIITPFILAWFHFFRERKKTKLKWKSIIEIVALKLSVLIVALLIFGNVIADGARAAAITYTLFVPVIWGALRFNTLGSVTTSFILSAVAIWSTSMGVGPFFRGDVSESLLYLQMFLGILSGTALILSANVFNRKYAEEELKKLNEELEERVKKRTFELRRAQEILDNAFEGIMIANGTQEHLIQYVNTAWENMTGWKSEEVIGKAAPRILKSGKMSLDFYKKLWGTILSGELFSSEITNKRKDGNFYEAEINIFRIKKSDYPDYYVEISRDITERKKMENQLAEYTKGLEVMVADRTKELEEKVADLEKLNKFMVGRELKMIELKDEIIDRQRKLEDLREKLPVVKAKRVTKPKKSAK